VAAGRCCLRSIASACLFTRAFLSSSSRWRFAAISSLRLSSMFSSFSCLSFAVAAERRVRSCWYEERCKLRSRVVRALDDRFTRSESTLERDYVLLSSYIIDFLALAT
jgi:hypothetical protein